MKLKKGKIQEVIEGLDPIIEHMFKAEENAKWQLEHVDSSYKKSAQNLIHYNAFRSYDIRGIQKKLKDLGLTRFANAEGHIMASLLTTRFLLGKLVDEGNSTSLSGTWSIRKGRRLLNGHTKDLLGYRSKGRRVRIMVTQPTEAAFNYKMVEQMVKNGMNCARINCAHDGPQIWKKIISNVHKASKNLDKKVKIAMDLAGPKIRTGQLPDGPKVKRFRPQKDVSGTIISPVKFSLIPEGSVPLKSNSLPIRNLDSNAFSKGDTVSMVDARGKHRQLTVEHISNLTVVVQAKKTIYVETGLVLTITKKERFKEFTVGELPPVQMHLLLKRGDVIEITKTEELGQPAVYDGGGKLIKRAKISCQMPEVFEFINTGESVLFDDGKIGGTIVEVHDDFFAVEILMAKQNGTKLRAHKGINFPDSKLGFSGLTKKDKNDLPFVVNHADIVNFSFVNRPEDVRELYEELERLENHHKLDVVLKIETKYAFDKLMEILMEAMSRSNIGVMIARGDLAIETGWENIGKIQNDMLSLCGAAHVPVIWATQVLENLAKTGLPSRSEITDAVTAIKAECVMLNKGPYINEAIKLLHTILSKMEASQDKNEVMLPKLNLLLTEK